MAERCNHCGRELLKYERRKRSTHGLVCRDCHQTLTVQGPAMEMMRATTNRRPDFAESHPYTLPSAEVRPRKQASPAPQLVPAELDRRCGKVVEMLQKCGEGTVLARLAYQKPGESWTTERIVEPYQFSYSSFGTIVLTWQVDPVLHSAPCWRNFRIDRIVRAEPAGTTFTPRQPITLHTGEITRFQMDNDPLASKSEPSVQQQYSERLRSALSDLLLLDDEKTVLIALRAQLDERQVMALNGRFYADLLLDYCADGQIEPDEIEKLTAARVWLNELGWTP